MTSYEWSGPGRRGTCPSPPCASWPRTWSGPWRTSPDATRSGPRYAAELADWAAAHGVGLPVVPAGREHPAHLFFLVLPGDGDRDASRGPRRGGGRAGGPPLRLAAGEHLRPNDGARPTTTAPGPSVLERRLVRIPLHQDLDRRRRRSGDRCGHDLPPGRLSLLAGRSELDRLATVGGSHVACSSASAVTDDRDAAPGCGFGHDRAGGSGAVAGRPLPALGHVRLVSGAAASAPWRAMRDGDLDAVAPDVRERERDQDEVQHHARCASCGGRSSTSQHRQERTPAP